MCRATRLNRHMKTTQQNTAWMHGRDLPPARAAAFGATVACVWAATGRALPRDVMTRGLVPTHRTGKVLR
jgi:hypothetical protein